jgi:hypothetical protein
MPDDHADLLVLVELLRSLTMGAERDAKGETERHDRFVRRHCSRLVYSAACLRTSAAAALS